MLRPIDADELLNKLLPPLDYLSIYLVQKIVKEAPTIDAVEVVRCRDCKRWITDSYWNGNPDQVRACRFAGWICGANGYCMYGERKMDAEVNHDQT